MTITLYKNFQKKINSTKQPAGGTEMDVKLKSGCSVESPTFLIDGVDLDVNYVKFANRYYYVKNIMLNNNNIYELVCYMDELATFKSDILNTTAYVQYSQSRYNKWIPDTRLTNTGEFEIEKEASLNPIIYGSTDISTESEACGRTIMTVAGSADQDAYVGLATQFMLDREQGKEVIDKLYDDSDSWAEQMLRQFTNPASAILEAHWIPFIPRTDIATSKGDIYFGTSNSSIRATKLGNYTHQSYQVTSVNIPWKYHDWRDMPEYCYFKLYLPYVGFITLDQGKFQDEERFDIYYILDPINGDVSYKVMCGDWTEFYTTNVATPIAVGQSISGETKALLSGATGVAQGALALATRNPGLVGAFAGSAVSTISDGLVSSFSTEASGSGVNGGFSTGLQMLSTNQGNWMRRPCVFLFYKKWSVSDPININTIEGRPLYETVQLGTLSGYVKCEGASVDIGGLQDDKGDVNQFLNAGIFIE